MKDIDCTGDESPHESTVWSYGKGKQTGTVRQITGAVSR